jgi:hypothetical protein
MSNKLGGKQGTAYLGTNANQPPNWSFNTRNPTEYDYQNVSLGDLWLNQENSTVWVLVSLQRGSSGPGSVAHWSEVSTSVTPGVVDLLTGDSGGEVGPDGGNNINIKSGVSGFSFVGNPGTNTLTFTGTSPSGDIVTLTGNSGGAVGPATGNINIVGDGTTIDIVGNPGTHTLTASVISGGMTVSQLDGDSGSATPSMGVINIIAGTSSQQAGSSVTFTGSGNTIEMSVTDANENTIIGKGSGNSGITGTNNTALGEGSLVGLTTGLSNTIIGQGSGIDLTSGSYNTILGADTGYSFTTGSNNVLVGHTAGANYTSSESSNIAIGAPGTTAESNVLRIGAGTGTSAGEINKSFISGIRGITPATSDGIPVFIGSAGQLGTVGTGGTSFVSTLTGSSGGSQSPSAGNINILAGSGISVVGTVNTLTISATGGGGSVNTLTANSGGAVSSSGGNINVVGDGSTVNIVGNPGTNTLTVSAINGGSQPLFLAQLATTLNNVTGNNLSYNVIFDTIIYNNGSNFNLGTSTFTAPINGVYEFTGFLSYIGVNSSNTRGSIQVTTTSGLIYLYLANYGAIYYAATAGAITLGVGGTATCYMTAGETALLNTLVQGSSKNVGILGQPTALAVSYFSGTLIG